MLKIVIGTNEGKVLCISNNEDEIKASMVNYLIDTDQEPTEDFFESRNWGEYDIEVYEYHQPQLNENQQSLIIWMQENECYNGDPLESISDLFLEGTPSEHFPDLPLSCVEAAYQSLNNQQKIEMVQKYLEQYFEQEAK
jgi:hypothetical protein